MRRTSIIVALTLYVFISIGHAYADSNADYLQERLKAPLEIQRVTSLPDTITIFGNVSNILTAPASNIISDQERALIRERGLDPASMTLKELFEFRENIVVFLDHIDEDPLSDSLYTYEKRLFEMKVSGIDIFEIDLGWMPEFVENGWVRALDEYQDVLDWPAFVGRARSTCLYKNRIWCVPEYRDVGMLYYRKDLLASLALEKPWINLDTPTPWGDVIHAAQRFQTPERIGLAFPGRRSGSMLATFFEFLWGNGGNLFDEEGRLVINRPKAVEALQFMVDLVHDSTTGIAPLDVLQTTDAYGEQRMRDGEAVFVRNWLYAWPAVDTSRIAMTLLPYNKRGAPPIFLGGWDLMVSAYSKHPDQAVKLIIFMTSDEVQTLMARDGRFLPVKSGVYADSSIYRSNPHFEYWNAYFFNPERAYTRPITPDYGKIASILKDHIDAALNQRETSEEALDEAYVEIKVVLRARSLSNLVKDYGLAFLTIVSTIVVLVSMWRLGLMPRIKRAKSKNQRIVGIILPLEEEFREFLSVVQELTPLVDKKTGQTYYTFPIAGRNDSSFLGIAMLIEHMGPAMAAFYTQRLLDKYSPDIVVNIGIAAGIHSDVRLGDVIVAEQVDNYMENAKALPGTSDNAFWFQLSGDPYKTDALLLNKFNNFEFAHPALYEACVSDCARDVAELLTEEKVRTLEHSGFIRSRPHFEKGRLASGPIVVSSNAFIDWLRNRDRQYKGLEMEAAGLALAMHHHPEPSRLLVIRGISDYGDEQKGDVDEIGDGALRRLAVRNATRLFLYFFSSLDASSSTF